MEEDNLDTRLELLLTTKTFGQLTAEEKSYALGFLSEEEYETYSLLLSQSKTALLTDYNKLQPHPETLHGLKQLFADKVSAKKADNFVFAKPLYQGLVAAALVIIIISLFINLRNGKQNPTSTKAGQHQIDSAIKRETLIAKSSDTPVSKPTASPKTNKEHYSVHKSRKASNYTALLKKKYKRNLCMDIRVAPTYSMIADTLSENTPGLYTRPVMPNNNTVARNAGGR